MLLDETAQGVVPLAHVGRPDDEPHELGRHEVLVIVQGPHGYVSPSWYPEGDVVPTWNHVTAHLHGTPELLTAEEDYRVLDHVERLVPRPRCLAHSEDAARRSARGTVGVRLRVTRVDARLELSHNRAPEVVNRIVAELEGTGPYVSPALAAEMRRVHPRRP